MPNYTGSQPVRFGCLLQNAGKNRARKKEKEMRGGKKMKRSLMAAEAAKWLLSWRVAEASAGSFPPPHHPSVTFQPSLFLSLILLVEDYGASEALAAL